MIELKDLYLDKISDEKLQQTEVELAAINDFFFNPQDTLIFKNDFSNLESLIKKDKRLIFYSHSTYLKQYYGFDNLFNLLDAPFSHIKEPIYQCLKELSVYIPDKILESAYHHFDEILEGFSTKEQEILRDYKGTPRFFFMQVDENLTKNNLVGEFWQKYFLEKINAQEMRSLLEHNHQKYEKLLDENLLYSSRCDYVVDYKKKVFSFEIVKNLAILFKLTPQEERALTAIWVEYELEIITDYVKAKNKATTRDFLLKIVIDGPMSKFYDLEERDVYHILSHKALLDSGVFSSDVNTNFGKYWTIGEMRGNKSIFYRPQDTSLEKLTSIFIKFDSEPITLSIKDYAYLEPNLSNLVKSLGSKPKDILLWGAPGFGKTELIKAISQELGIKIVSASDKSVTDNIRLNLLASSKNIKQYVADFCVLVDEAEDILKDKNNKIVLTKELENKKVHTFWIINSIEDIPEAYLRRMDYILEVNEMPLDKRVEVASAFLGDKGDASLAYKMAQAIHTPAEIKSAVEWCHSTNNYTWPNISNKLMNYQRAIAKSIKNEIGNFTIKVTPPEQGCSLADFAGYHYIKEEAKEILDIFAHPDKYSKVGAKIPKGVLLAGSPGVGKTMFTRCLASELSTTLVTADSSELAAKPERIKILFEKAKAQAPCIVFIDELDVLGSKVVDAQGNISTEKQKILNQLLVELDGFHSFSGVMVIGATHRSSFLDESLTRSGRFGKTIYFRSPSLQDRKEIIEHYCDKIVVDNVNYHQLAKLSASFTSADIAMSVNEAALLAARKNKASVSNQDLVDAINQVFFGASLNGLPVTAKNKWKTAIHEAGHALVSIKVGQAPQRATIKPHLDFMGMVQLEEREGTYGVSWSQVKQKVQIFIAGLVAEEIIFSEHSNGVESDLQAINRFIERAIKTSGMSQSLGSMTVSAFQSVSPSLLDLIEKEQKSVIDEAKRLTKEWLVLHKKELVDFAKILYEERSLDEEFMKSWFNKNILNKDALSEDLEIEALIELAYRQ